MIRCWIFMLLLSQGGMLLGQDRFNVEVRKTGEWTMAFDLVNEAGEVFKSLDTTKYYPIDLKNEGYGYFAVFGLYDSMGWYAIDAQERVLFRVYNTIFGESSPDILNEDRIRIVDGEGLIGYADERGKIVIPPTFESATVFNDGKAIVGRSCKRTPWGRHDHDGPCNHFVTFCRENGYINMEGEILEIGAFSFGEIARRIGWRSGGR